MSRSLVVGAGPIGTGVARLLAARGDEVLLASRGGTDPGIPQVRAQALDATDATRLTEAAAGAVAIYNCANPAYHRWPTDWPPIAAALLTAAERSGATLVTVNNLYAYGPPSGPMRAGDPDRSTTGKAGVRARMTADAMAAHAAGRLRAVEVRASDFIGPGAESHLGDRVVPKLLAGKRCSVLGDPDAPHSWTYTVDVARTLVACADQPSAHGRVWHAVTNPPRSQREAIDELADAAGVRRVKVGSVPRLGLRVAGLFNPMIRELPEVLYQFERPFVIDDAETRAVLGLEPTPWPEVLRVNLDAFRPAA
jgi:nucleoside-diphosphate-sugar epimerase